MITNRIIEENSKLSLENLRKLANNDLSAISSDEIKQLLSLIDLLAKPDWAIDIVRLANLGQALIKKAKDPKAIIETEICYFHQVIQKPNGISLWQSGLNFISTLLGNIRKEKKQPLVLSEDEKEYIESLAKLAIQIYQKSSLEPEQRVAYDIHPLAKIGMILTVALSVAMIPIGLFSAFGSGLAILGHIVWAAFATCSSAMFGGSLTYYRIRKSAQERLQAEKAINAKRNILAEYNRLQCYQQIKTVLDKISEKYQNSIDGTTKKNLLLALRNNLAWEEQLRQLIDKLKKQSLANSEDLLATLENYYLPSIQSNYANQKSLNLARTTNGLKFWEYLAAGKIIKTAIMGLSLTATIYGSLFGLSKLGLIGSLLSLAGGPAATLGIVIIGTILIAALLASIVYIRFKKWQANQELTYNKYRFDQEKELGHHYEKIATKLKHITSEQNATTFLKKEEDFFLHNGLNQLINQYPKLEEGIMSAESGKLPKNKNSSN